MALFQLRISLRVKIVAIGLVGLLGLFFVGGIYLVGARNQARYQETADQASMVAKVDSEKEFLLRSDEAMVKDHEAAVQAASNNLAELRERLILIGQAGLANKAEEARGGVESYAGHYATLVAAKRTLGLNQDSGLEKTLRSTVMGIENDLEKFDDARLVAGIHPVRRWEREYMLRRDSAANEAFKKALAEFTASFSGASIPAATKRLMTEKLGGYQRDFDEWVSAAETVDREARLTTAEYAKVAPNVEAVAKGIDALYTDAMNANAASRDSTRTLILVALAVAIVVVGALAFLIGQSVSRPLSRMTAAMRRLAEGDFQVELPGLGRRDEIGEMAKAVEVFKMNAIENRRLVAEQREAEERAAEERRQAEERARASELEAEQKAAAERKASMNQLADEFEKVVGNIVEAVSSASSQLESAAGRLTKTAETTQNLADRVADTSEEASSNVQTVAASADELAASVAEIARQVQESSRIAAQAVEQAGRTDSRINELSQLASRVGDVVKFITAIAEQTNLLALNATIEAARAGEAGKGFAVVAQEVKALAAQTAKATDEISAQIAGMQAATNDSVSAIKEIGKTIQRISEIAAHISTSVEQQGAATREIARNVQQAAQGTSEVASNITDVNKGASETGAASGEVLTAAHSLSRESAHLKSELAKFLATVRAA
jgi:methyl-accepting chemotaxis protein